MNRGDALREARENIAVLRSLLGVDVAWPVADVAVVERLSELGDR